MGKHTRRKQNGGTLVLKKSDRSLQQRVQELGGDRVGVVPVDVAKQRVSAMVADFYGNILVQPGEYAVSAAGLESLDRMIEEAQMRHGLKLMVVGLEQTGRLHEPARRFLQRRWEVRLIHPLVTSHLRQGIAHNTKTDGMDLEAQMRAVTGCYGRPAPAMPVAFERWRAVHRNRQQLIDERVVLKQRMHERLHAVLPGFSTLFDNLWGSRAATAAIELFDSPAALRACSEKGLQRKLRGRGGACSAARAAKLLAWAADAAPVSPAATTEAEILREDLRHMAALTGRIERCDQDLLGFLVQTPFVLLLGVAGIGHVLASGIGAEAGPMQSYANCRNLSGRAGLYPRRYQSDGTDRQGGMARGQPLLRDALMKAARCVVMPTGAFYAWGESRRRNGREEKQIFAAMANRLCRIIHVMVLSGQTFDHPDAKPGVSILGKLLNCAAHLGIEADNATQLARQAVAQIPPAARAVEREALASAEWTADHPATEHGASTATTRAISRHTVPALLDLLNHTETTTETSTAQQIRSP